MLRPVLAALLALAALPRGAAEPLAPAFELENAFAALAARKIPDGRLYAPFYLGVIAPHALVARGTVYCAFQNSTGRPIVMAYRAEAKAWDGPVKASDFGLGGGDDHGNPAIACDRQGHLHVFYGCHGGPMRHARSARPGRGLSSWRGSRAGCVGTIAVDRQADH